MKVTIILLKILFIGALFIVSNQNLYLSQQQDLDTFLGLYYSWLDSLYLSAVDITGYVVNVEWLPHNSTQLDSVG